MSGLHDRSHAYLADHTNYRIAEVTGSEVTVSANGTYTINVPLPSTGTAIAVVGWYFLGGAGCSIYGLKLTNSGAQIMVRNFLTTQQKVTTTARYLVVD